MNTSGILLLLALPLAAIETACGHSAEEHRSHETAMFVNNKERGYLGVSVDDVTPKLARRKSLKVEEGVYVQNVEEDSPAETAGIEEGDVIVEFDGKKISANNDLISAVRKTKPGTEVSIAVNRDGEKKHLKATIEKLPREYSSIFTVPSPPRAPRIHIAPHISIMRESAMYGLTLEELNRQLGKYFGAPNDRGLLVKSVKRNSEAEKAGFKAGDVIVKVGKEAIEDLNDYWRALEDFKDGEKADIEVLRKGSTQKLTITVNTERDLGFHSFDGDDDIDLCTPEEGRHTAERLKRELEKMKDNLQDRMIELKNELKKGIERARASVNV